MWSCCVNHNMLLKHDGLEFLWTDGWVRKTAACMTMSNQHDTEMLLEFLEIGYFENPSGIDRHMRLLTW
jgi:hypothetical protein